MYVFLTRLREKELAIILFMQFCDFYMMYDIYFSSVSFFEFVGRSSNNGGDCNF